MIYKNSIVIYSNFIVSRNEFNCAVYDCPHERPPSKECLLKHDHEKCCSTDYTCPPFDKTPTCIVNNNTYYEGQYFSSPDPCVECICQKGFKGKYVEPFCKKVNCGTGFRGFHIQNKCAPVFYEELCCPIEWECRKY